MGTFEMTHMKVGCFLLVLAMIGCAHRGRSSSSERGAMAAGAKTSGVYTSIISFAGQEAMSGVVNAKTSFLKDKHKKAMATSSSAANIELARRCGFNTIYM